MTGAGDSEDIFFEDPEIDIIVQNSGDALVSLVPEGDKRKKKKLKSTHNSSLCATSTLHALPSSDRETLCRRHDPRFTATYTIPRRQPMSYHSRKMRRLRNIYSFSNARSYLNLRRTCVRHRNSKTMVKRYSLRKVDGL